MQSILFLKSDGVQTDRIINLDLIATASTCSENPEWTECYCGIAKVILHMPFAKFLEQVEQLISENYRIGVETSAQWHKKRMDDTQRIMAEVMAQHLNH